MGRVHRHTTLFAANNVGCEAPIPRPLEGTRASRVNGPRKTRPSGVPGLTLCPIDLPAPRNLAHNVIPGSPGRHDAVYSPGAEAGRRRTIGVVAAPSILHERPRRWCDAGAPRRQSVPAAQKAGVEVANVRGRVRIRIRIRNRCRTRDRNRGRPGHTEKTFIGTCRVRSCAGSTFRHRGALGTTTLPGTPREER